MHEPVLVKEVVAFLDPRPGRTFLAATVGLGRHAEALIAPVARGIDQAPRHSQIAAVPRPIDTGTGLGGCRGPLPEEELWPLCPARGLGLG